MASRSFIKKNENSGTPLWRALLLEHRIPYRYNIYPSFFKGLNIKNKLLFLLGVYKQLSIIYGHTFMNEFDKNSVIVDLGANKGKFAGKYIEKIAYSRLILVEANPFLVKELERLFKDLNNVKVINAAVGNGAKSQVNFFISSNDESSSLFKPVSHKSSSEKIKVKMISVDDIFSMFNLNRIHLLKMDIEGAEWEILQKFSRKHFNRIDQVSVEFHDFMYPRLRKKTENCIRHLKRLGYSFAHRPPEATAGSPYMDCLFFKQK